MARSISEFIQEQETGYEFSSNDNYVKAYAETAAAISLAQCYAEQAVIAEFAASNNINSLRIVQEADEEKKDGIFKRAGNAIKNAWKKFIEFLKSVVRKIKDWFRGKKVESVEKAIADLSPDTEITVDANVLYPALIIGMADAFTETLKKETGNSTTLLSRMKTETEYLDKVINGEKGTIKDVLARENIDVPNNLEIKDGRITLTIGQYKVLIKGFKDTKMDQKTSAILNELSRIETEYGNFVDTAGGGYDDPTDEAAYQSKAKEEMSAQMKKYMNGFARLNEKAMKYMNSIDADVDKMIKNAKGDNGVGPELTRAKAATESFYFV